MALIETLVVFVVSLLVGGIGIYVGASVLTDVEDYTYAVVTALIGAVVWGVISFFVGWVPLLGAVLAFVAYTLVLHARYPGGLAEAVGIALIAMVASVVVLFVLGLVGLDLSAAGVPGA